MNQQPLYNGHPSYQPLSYQPLPTEPGKGMAVAGLTLGIISLVIAFVPVFGIIPPVLGIIFSAVGMRSVTRHGQAVAGLVCSLIAVFLSLLMIAVYTAA